MSWLERRDYLPKSLFFLPLQNSSSSKSSLSHPFLVLSPSLSFHLSSEIHSLYLTLPISPTYLYTITELFKLTPDVPKHFFFFLFLFHYLPFISFHFCIYDNNNECMRKSQITRMKLFFPPSSPSGVTWHDLVMGVPAFDYNITWLWADKAHRQFFFGKIYC